MSAADSNMSLPEKKSGYTFGQNKTLFPISLYQKYEENCRDNGCNGSLSVGRHICYAMTVYSARTDGVFFMQAIRIIPSIPYQPFLFQNSVWIKNAPYVYICRLRSIFPILEVYIQLVMNSMDIEKQIAFNNSTITSFKKK